MPGRPRRGHLARTRGRSGVRRAERRADRAHLGRGRSTSTGAASIRRCSSACAARARSCSTARSATRRGNGPSDDRETPKVAATTETPFCVYSTSKAVTALVVHMLAERGALAIDDRVADHIPEYARHGKGEITIGHVLAHRAGVASLPREALDLDLLDDREHLLELICDAKPASAPGRLLAYHAVSGGFILGEIVHRVDGPRDPRGARGRDPRPARLPLGQLRGRRRRRRAGRAQLHHRAAAAAAGLEPGHPGARGAGRPRDRDLERPALPHRRGPGGERGHDRERALALLRDLPPRRRARRRPGDGDRDPAAGAGRAVAARDRPLARLPDPVLATG